MVSEQFAGSQQGLVIFAKNKTRVSAFYQRTLALEATESEASHDVLLGHGYEVVIHAIPEEYAADIDVSHPPQPRENTPFKPTFVVQELEATRVAAVLTGGSLKPIEHVWQWRNYRVLDGFDPEGNIVQFKQRV